MAIPKSTLIDKAVEITKAYASSGSHSQSIALVLRQVYEELVKLNNENQE